MFVSVESIQKQASENVYISQPASKFLFGKLFSIINLLQNQALHPVRNISVQRDKPKAPV